MEPAREDGEDFAKEVEDATFEDTLRTFVQNMEPFHGRIKRQLIKEELQAVRLALVQCPWKFL